MQQIGETPTTQMSEDDLRRIVREEIQAALGASKDPGTQRAAIIASKGTLDWLQCSWLTPVIEFYLIP